MLPMMLAIDKPQRRTGTPIERTRIGGSRSRSGCQTCRSRKVKCDETKPTCNRCLKLGLQCDAKPVEATAQKKQIDRVIIYVGPVKEPRRVCLDDTSHVALEYFFTIGASDLGSSCSSELWKYFIPRLTTSDDAVRNAAIALSMFHRSFSTQHESWNLDRPLAFKHYGKSLAKLREGPQDASSSERSLVCCTMFYVIEALQAHFSSAASILTKGIQLLTEFAQSEQAPDKEHFRLLRRTLTLLGTAAMAIEETGSERCFWLATQECLRDPDPSLSALEATRDELSLLMNDILCLDFRVSFSIKAAEEQPTVLDEINAIRERYNSFLENIASFSDVTDQTQNDRATELILHATRIMFKIALDTVGTIPQSIFDQFLPQFDLIVQICEEFISLQTDQNINQSNASGSRLSATFTMCLGIVPCLYFVCIRCRDSTTRHTALSLLKRCNRREGVWDSHVAGVVAEMWIRYEEGAARRYWKEVLGCDVGDQLIPEELRIDHMLSKFGSEKSAQIQFALTTGVLVVERAMEW